jgi:hypothetical protein
MPHELTCADCTPIEMSEEKATEGLSKRVTFQVRSSPP